MKVANASPERARSYLDAYVDEIAEAIGHRPMTQAHYGHSAASLRLDVTLRETTAALEERGWGYWSLKGAQLPVGSTVMVHKRRKLPILLGKYPITSPSGERQDLATISFCGLELPRWNEIIAQLPANEYGTRKLKLGRSGLVYAFQRDHNKQLFPDEWEMRSTKRGTAIKRAFYVSQKIGASAIVFDMEVADGSNTYFTMNPEITTME